MCFDLVTGGWKSAHTHIHTAKVRNQVNVDVICRDENLEIQIVAAFKVTLSTPHVVQLIYAAHIYLRNIQNDMVNNSHLLQECGISRGFISFFSNAIQLQPTDSLF